MPHNDTHKDAPTLVRVPSNVVNAATADGIADKPEKEKTASESESNEDAQPEFKEGGYGW